MSQATLRHAALATLLVVISATLAACGKPKAAAPAASGPFASTYAPLPSKPTLITHATVLTGTGARLDNASVLLENGKVTALGSDVAAPAGAVVIDAKGRFVTPGIIDVHSHLGVYASPGTNAASDGNEAVAPNTAEVWAEHSLWPQDPQFATALAGGITSMQILPGSANLFGGRGVTVKNVPARTMQEMKFPGAKHGLKMACGENPKRVYGDSSGPSTRMGNVAGYREAWIKAKAYKDKLDKSAKGKGDAPDRDLKLETLAGVLSGDIIVHNHCYRADEMAVMIDIAKEFGYRIGTFHHAVESYKVADLLAKDDICSAMWADWWGFKMEAYDGVRENVALVDAAGACAVVHSDSATGIQRLNQEAAKSMASGNRIGLKIAPEHAIRWITANAAKSLGVQDKTGTLEPGKDADVVLWSSDPFSVHAKADLVFVDGAVVWDRMDKAKQPISDFMLGILWWSGGAAMNRVLVIGGAFTLAALALAAPVEAAAGGKTVAIVHAKAHTIGKGTIDDATLIIRDGRIAAIGKGLAAPAGAEVIDAAGRPVTPGLFDALGAIGVLEVELEDPTVDRGNGDHRYSAAFAVADGFNPRSPKVAITRIEGVTRALVAPVTMGGDGVTPVIAGQAATIHLGLGDGLLLDTSAALVVDYGEAGKGLAGGTRGAALLQLREALDDARDWARNRNAYDAGARRAYSRGRLDLEALQRCCARSCRWWCGSIAPATSSRSSSSRGPRTCGS